MTGTDLADVSVLDVGHGNCVLVTKNERSCVIDTPPGTTLIEALLAQKVTRVDAIFISHADVDHVGGVIGLLTSKHFAVGAVFVNPDAVRATAMWRAFRVALRDARRRDAVEIASLTTQTRFSAFEPEVRFTVVGPEPELVLGGKDLDGVRLTANSLSGVVLVEHRGVRLVLVPGDLDSVGLKYLINEQRDIRSKVLIFPHHGGLPGARDPTGFAKILCRAVNPKAVVFSLGRGRFRNPSPDVVKAVREAVPGVYVACTQLSPWCAQSLPANDPTHLSPRPARGKPLRSCCAGTLVLTGVEPSGVLEPLQTRHREFIDASAPTALCKAPAHP